MGLRHLSRIVASAVIVLAAHPGVDCGALGWDGFYAGVNAGGALGTAKMSFDPNGLFRGPTAGDIADGNFFRSTRDLNSTGLAGALQVGYQARRGRFVPGLEAEVGHLGLKDSFSLRASVPGSGNTYQFNQDFLTTFFSSLRPRLGYVPERFSDNVMLFATAGPSMTRVRVNQRLTQIGVNFISDGLSEARMLLGWAAGGGVEYALSKQLSVKAEYLYVDIGSIKRDTVSGSPSNFAGYTSSNRADLSAHIMRLGTSFHF